MAEVVDRWGRRLGMLCATLPAVALGVGRLDATIAPYWGFACLIAGGVAVTYVVHILKRPRVAAPSASKVPAETEVLGGIVDDLPGTALFRLERSVDGDTRMTFASAGSEALFGASADALVKDPSLMFGGMMRADRLTVRKAIEESAQTMAPYVVEFRIREAQTGRVSTIRSAARPHRLDDGRIIWNGVSTRIGSMRNVDQEYREANRMLLEEITDGIPGGVFQLGRSSEGAVTVLFASPGIDRLAGVLKGSRRPVTEGLLNRLVSSKADGISDDIAASAQRQQPIARDLQIELPDGGSRWIHIAAIPYTVGDDEVIWNGHIIDITERKTLESELERTRAHITELAQNLPGVVYQSCLYADGTVELLFNHEGYYRLMGIEHSEPRIPYLRVVESVLEEDREGVLDELTRASAELHPLVIEFRVHRDGEIRWIHVEAIPKSGGTHEVLAIWNAYGVDVTERKRLEADLAQARDAAEAANRAKSEFLANMSHEIRTPMNAIIGLTHLAARREMDDVQRDYLRKIDGASRSLLHVINDILDVSKIEAGKMSLEQTAFAPEWVLSQLKTLLSVRAAEKGLVLDCRVAPGTPRTVIGDPMRLNQILLNLAGNSVKFTDQGFVTVSLRHLQPPAVEDDGHCWLECTVSDSGIGIDAHAQAHLFESFMQADASTTRRFGGTGLGLAITRSLVEMMHGRIECSSAPGRGTTFTVRLRLGYAASADVEDTALGSLTGQSIVFRRNVLSGRRILLVEDNLLNQQVACEVLESAGAEVIVASDGLQALTLAEHLDLDLVLLDLQMPRMDGFETAKALRGRGFAPPIIATTASVTADDHMRCLKAGMNGHVAKPLEISALAKAIGNVLLLDPDMLVTPLAMEYAAMDEDGAGEHVEAASEKDIEALMDQLDQQLSQHDAEAADTARHLRGAVVLAGKAERTMSELLGRIDNYRFADARGFLGRLRDEMTAQGVRS